MPQHFIGFYETMENARFGTTNQKVGGSNPFSRTKESLESQRVQGFPICLLFPFIGKLLWNRKLSQANSKKVSQKAGRGVQILDTPSFYF